MRWIRIVTALLLCIAASGSSTAYACNTSPSFTPVDDNTILSIPDVGSGSSGTLSVNSGSALHISPLAAPGQLIGSYPIWLTRETVPSVSTCRSDNLYNVSTEVTTQQSVQGSFSAGSSTPREIGNTGVTFPDRTVQSTAGFLLTGGMMTRLIGAPTSNAVNCGASTWAGSDAGARINSCMASLAGATGEALIPAGAYTIDTQILVPSNVWLHGQSKDATILVGGSTLSAPCLARPRTSNACQVIRILGTSGTPTVNVHISDLTVENGTAQTGGFNAGMDGIRADYVNGLLIERVHVTSIQGAYGVAWKNSTNVKLLDSVIDNYTYSGAESLEGNDHVWVERNSIGGVTCANGCGSNGIIGYTFASGSETGRASSAPYTTNLWVDHNYFHDSPHWECLDTHGGQHIWFEDNTLRNCATGINASLNSAILASPVAASDFHILRNTVIQGTGAANCTNCFGLALTGRGPTTSPVAPIYPVMDAEVKDNIFYGFGGIPGAANPGLVGVIEMHDTRNADIEGNKFYNWYTVAIMLMNDNWNATIERNTAYDMAGAYNSTLSSSMIRLRSGGNWGITIDENLLKASSLAVAPAHMIDNLVQNSQITLGSRNSATYVSSNLYSSRTPASKLNAKAGDPVYDTRNRPNRYFGGASMPQSGFSSLDTRDVIATATCTAGSNIISSLSGGLGGVQWWYWLPEGMNIVLAGCGTSGANLNAIILSDDGTQLTVDPAASTSQTAATITYRGAAIVKGQ